jgi:small-conductance mechanosensitive channel
METLREIWEQVKAVLDVPIFTLGESHFTLWTFFYLVVFFLLLVFVAGRVRTWVSDLLLVRLGLDVNRRLAVGWLVQYSVIFLGLLILLQTAGIDLTTVNILAGAVGIGVGFGLQSIASNFISGLIILFERPIKLGDRVEVGAVEGDVVRVGARSTTVVTNDNIAIIIPNGKFISENVINWSYTDDKVRFRVPVSVAYGSDLRLVEKLLLEAAAENPDVLKEPAPAVRLMEFGDSGVLFELRPWSTALLHRRGKLTSDLNFAIWEKFRQHGIEIPFPQRDVHIRTGPPPPPAPKG